MIVREFFRLSLKWLWLIFWLGVAAALIAVAAGAFAEPELQSQAGIVVVRSDLQLQIEPRYRIIQEDLIQLGRSTDRMPLLVALVRNETIAESVFQELPDPKPFGVKQPRQLLGYISGQFETSMIKILAKGPDAEAVILLADLWAKYYARFINDLYASDVSLRNIENQLASAQERHDAANTAFVEFVESGEIDRLDREYDYKKTLFDNIVEQKRIKLTREFNEINQRLSQMQTLLTDAQILQLTQSATSTSSANVAGLLSLLFLQTDAVRSFSDRSALDNTFQFVLQPATLDEFAGASALVAADLSRLLVVFNDELASYARQAEAMEAALLSPPSLLEDEAILQAMRELDALQSQRLVLQNRKQELQAERERLWNSYSLLLNKQEELRIAADVEEKAAVRYALPASAARRLSRPAWQNALLGGLLGVMLALGIAFVLELSDDKARSHEDLRSAAHAPYLGGLPLASTLPEEESAAPPGVRFVDAVRFLRAEIDRAQPQPRSLLVASFLPGEGKSTVAHHLAQVAAASGRPTLLVDANLRSPALHLLCGCHNDAGLAEVLLGEARLAEALQQTATPGLHLLSAGQNRARALDRLAAAGMGEVVAALGEAADRVIIDTPALHRCADALALSAWSDAALLVITPGSTPVDAVQACAEGLDGGAGRFLGVVMNRIPPQDLNVFGDPAIEIRGLRRWLGLVLPPPLARRITRV